MAAGHPEISASPSHHGDGSPAMMPQLSAAGFVVRNTLGALAASVLGFLFGGIAHIAVFVLLGPIFLALNRMGQLSRVPTISIVPWVANAYPATAFPWLCELHELYFPTPEGMIDFRTCPERLEDAIDACATGLVYASGIVVLGLLFNVRGARTFLMASHVGVVSGTHSSYTTKPLRIAFAVALSCAANIAGICAFVWAMYDRWYMTNLCSAIGYTLAFYYAMFLMARFENENLHAVSHDHNTINNTEKSATPSNAAAHAAKPIVQGPAPRCAAVRSSAGGQ